MRNSYREQQEPEYQVVVQNGGAFAQNFTAQWQLAEWLIQFGIDQGLIKDPGEGEDFYGNETAPLCIVRPLDNALPFSDQR